MVSNPRKLSKEDHAAMLAAIKEKLMQSTPDMPVSENMPVNQGMTLPNTNTIPASSTSLLSNSKSIPPQMRAFNFMNRIRKTKI